MLHAPHAYVAAAVHDAPASAADADFDAALDSFFAVDVLVAFEI